MWSGDTYPASAFALNFAFFKTVYFDNLSTQFFGQTIPYFFQRNLSGHLVSAYPIGSTIFYLPVHTILALIEWLGVGSCDPALGVSHFEACRLFNDKISSACAAAFQGVLFWRLTRHYLVSQTMRMLCTLFFAVGTDAFAVTAHTNFQHGPTITLLLLGWLVLKHVQTRGHEAGPARNATNYLLIGLILGLMVSVRPSNVLFAPAFAWSLWYSRAILLDGLFMVCGGLIGAFGVYWNVANFASPLGGMYGSQGPLLFAFSAHQFTDGFLGLMISPSHGLFVFTPV